MIAREVFGAAASLNQNCGILLGGGLVFSFSGAVLDFASEFWFSESLGWSLAPKVVPFHVIYAQGPHFPSGFLSLSVLFEEI